MRAIGWAGILIGIMSLSAPANAASAPPGTATPPAAAAASAAGTAAPRPLRHRQRRHAARRHGRTQTGFASWYGAELAGRRTASGERFDPHALTAAHATLPLNSRARVTNIRNGRTVTVRITDRGIGQSGRVIDLSRAAAARLGMLESGLARVRVEALPTRRAVEAER